jgi:hypothetical protein
MISKIAFLALLFALPAIGQDVQLLQGRVVFGTDGIAGVFVINSTTGKETRTDGSGNFTLEAKSGERLAIYSPKIVTREFMLNNDSFKTSPYVITVNYQAYELDEVVIEESINSESLGLVPKGQKQLTPAEKKLRTAGDFKPIQLLGIIGGGMQFDPILNAINGKTKMLKKAVETEKKVLLMEKIDNLYSEEEIISGFKIPADYVDGFIYYVTEDAAFAAAIKEKNEVMAKFLMSGLAVQYLELITNE